MAKKNTIKNEHRINQDKKVKPKRFVLTKYKLNANIGGHKAGEIITLECRKIGGAPKERYWRNRLREALIDGCMEKAPKEPILKPVTIVEQEDPKK